MEPNEIQAAQEARRKLANQYNNTRHNLLLVVIFSLVNIALLAANSNTYFVFSAFIPYAIVDVAMFLCGRYPVEFYEDMTGLYFYDDSVFVAALIVALVMVAFYLLCWLLTKKGRAGWMIASLVFFALDTVLMLLVNGLDASMMMDIIFHGWVLVSLFLGIRAHFKLKKMPEEEPAPEAQPEFPVCQD